MTMIKINWMEFLKPRIIFGFFVFPLTTGMVAGIRPVFTFKTNSPTDRQTYGVGWHWDWHNTNAADFVNGEVPWHRCWKWTDAEV